jgi:hypothetical protein
LAFHAFRLPGSNEIYAYEKKSSGTKIICNLRNDILAGPGQGDLDGASRVRGLETMRRHGLIGSPHHMVRPLALDRDINGVLAVEYYAAEDSAMQLAAQLSTVTTHTCPGGCGRWPTSLPRRMTGRLVSKSRFEADC